ncbi:helix-turn-helix domain-containing protein [Sphingopyxis indica]|uniref:helix-turn-helix domain-containing protein n=2 Tax=Sphingomonadales TaxID=204457 RepID=UPI0029390542|nr:helix-turn-helix domain-containing protein [Sphingopyxis indica]
MSFVYMIPIRINYESIDPQRHQMEDDLLKEIGDQLRRARQAARLTQEQVADLAGISRPRYRDIETGAAAARATTLINIARAVGLEMMLVPQAVAPAVAALLHPETDDDRPAFSPQPEER